MQNSLSAPPKDQGDANVPCGAGRSGRSVPSKSHFRTIAPKLAPRVLTPRVLPCPAPLSDPGTLGAALSPKPLGVPTQKYALMQVAGQEGTFSLVALPPVASAQPLQKPRVSGSLKLPIPRCQPLRSNRGPRKKPNPGSPESGSGRPPAFTQTCPPVSPSPPARPELPQKASPCKQVASPTPAPEGASAAGLTEGSCCTDLALPVTHSCRDPSPHASPALLTPAEPCAERGPSDSSGKASYTSNKVCSGPAAAAGGKLRARADHAKATGNVPPAPGTSGAAPPASSIPGGKPPTPPCLRRTAAGHGTESDADTAGPSLPGLGTDRDRRPPSVKSPDGAAAEASETPVSPPRPEQSLCSRAFCPVIKPDLGHRTKLSIGAAKSKERKRKGPDEILAFQGKKRKCFINKSRDGKEKAKVNLPRSKDQQPGSLKKYRSIMPKPVVVVSALPPLAPPTAPPQPPGGLGQDVALRGAGPAKGPGGKHGDSPAPRPGSVLRNGFCGPRRPWPRCQVCNHPFQFKQPLREHMSAHPDRRPRSCRGCRKAYARPGSLSAHAKPLPGEARPRRPVRCDFCAKVFGHVRVYFGHLREAHRVVISAEPAPGDAPRGRGGRAGQRGPERENKSSLEEDFLLNQADEVKLQITCGRCQITAQSLAEIKFHLLCVHGEEIQGRFREDASPGRRGAQEAPAAHAASARKPRPERSEQGPPSASEEASRAPPGAERQPCPDREDGAEMPQEEEGAEGPRHDPQGPECPGRHAVFLWSRSGFSCLLCSQTLGRKEELLLHWEHRHHCEDPARLWALLSALSSQGLVEVSRGAGK